MRASRVGDDTELRVGKERLEGSEVRGGGGAKIEAGKEK